jgi:hypothetical protein
MPSPHPSVPISMSRMAAGSPFNIGIGCVVNSSNITYNVEHTFDAGSSAFISSNAGGERRD